MSQPIPVSEGGGARPAPPARPGPLGRIAGWSFRHRGRTVLLWLLVMGAAVGLSSWLGGTYSADYTAPGSDSRIARDLLQQRFPGQAEDTITVVVTADGGVTAPATRARLDALVATMAAAPHVRAVESPYPPAGLVSPDGRTAVGQLRLDVVNPIDMPKADTRHLLDLARDASGPEGLTVALGGQAVREAEQGAIGSEGLGIAAAAIILLLTFGSVVAAGLPLVTAVAGLAVSSLLIPVVAAATAVPDWSTSLAAMMGIGVGIDYVLLMVTRFRQWRLEGLDPEAATVATLDTAGRSVLVAGITVVASMLGLFAMGLSFMRGAAYAAILAVLIVLAAAGTLFPALLGYFGRHIDRLRLPLPRRRTARVATGTSTTGPGTGATGPGTGWLRWSRLVERHRIVATLAGLAILLALAAPFLGVRFGFPDAGNDPAGKSSRQAYDRISDAFGPGMNGALLLVVTLPGTGDATSLAPLATTLRGTPGVASVAPPRLSSAGDTAVLTVVPTTGPQAKATGTLVRTLRDDVLPAATAGTGATVHVGGLTASSIDSTENIVKRLPLLIGGVVAVSMLLLLVSFRSVAVVIKAAVMNLLSVAAAYGVVALVLQGGWAGRLVGIASPTPLAAFIPVLMFAVLFGLSMDYEVFLVSRMREAWLRTGSNAESIVEGLAGTARVITAAAAIMVAVFAAFIPAPDIPIKVIGVGMAAAILIDATVVRLLLVPAVMHLLGQGNWWLPDRLGRLIPQLHVEGRPDRFRTPPRADRAPQLESV
jgi:RND superfamily putative drug exporter